MRSSSGLQVVGADVAGRTANRRLRRCHSGPRRSSSLLQVSVHQGDRHAHPRRPRWPPASPTRPAHRRRRRPRERWSPGGTDPGPAASPGGAHRSTSSSGPATMKPALVPDDRAVQPIGARRRADEARTTEPVSTFSSSPDTLSPQRQSLEVLVAVAADDLGAGADRDVRDAVDLLDQVVRHRRLQRRAADQHRHRLARTGRSTRRPGRPNSRRRRCRRPARRSPAPRTAPSRRTRRARRARPAPGAVKLPVGHPGRQDHGVRVDRCRRRRTAPSAPNR